MIGGYTKLLGRRQVVLPFVASILARLPIAMGPLGLVVLMEELRGSYAGAGTLAGVFAWCSALATPMWGALMDRIGQPRVIGGTSAAAGACLAALTLAAVAGAPYAVLVALSACVGLSFPPISAAIRVAWSTVVEEGPELRSAYAMDAAAIETVFVGGPLLLTLLLLGPPALPLLVTAFFLAAGGVGYSRTYAARAWRSAGAADLPAGPPDSTPAGGRGRSPLRSRELWLTFTVGAFLAVGFGLVDVTMTATGERIFDSTGLLGAFFACVAGGSAIGGLWYGSRSWSGPERRHLPVTLACFAGGLLLLGLVLSASDPLLGAMFPIMVVTGLCIAPSLIVLQALTDAHAQPGRRGEAQGWLSTALTSGSAVGMGVCGVVIDGAGPRAGFAMAALAVGLAALTALSAQRALRSGDPVPEPALSTAR